MMDLNKIKVGLGLDSKIPFGQYKGMTVNEVGAFDLEYLDWLVSNSDLVFKDEVIMKLANSMTNKDKLIEVVDFMEDEELYGDF